MGISLLIGVALLLVLAAGSPDRSGAGGASGGGGGLSAIRARALAILVELLPASYPSTRFERIVGAGFSPATSAGTTCGALPGTMGRMLGDPTGITKYGVPGVETEGRRRGAWIEAASGREPKPGDIYLTEYIDGPYAGMVAHTGVVTEVNGSTWITADAGQGPAESPRAEYVTRQYDRQTQILTRDGVSRRVRGWIDLDKAMAAVPRSARQASWMRDGEVWPCDPAECRVRQ